MPKAAISVAGSDQIVKQIRDPLIQTLQAKYLNVV